ncbi:uncharacterized protein LOC124941562 [Impatiens glandulifera]|uniref:uncharacterized protein LOC124941562 n=1 Tax=Impatiens glandulifera TaxID=253017 RepID=UPI001FB15038|nr:uncharacterized protein LOC124941562 [Impatiens glandulifera]
MGDLRIADGLALEDRPPTPSSTIWDVAEETTLEILRCIRPTLDSEEKRRDVIDYVQRLIRNSLGHEVFPYGSVPLKTYLPDGDIDLTVICNPGAEDTLSHEVHAILLAEQDNEKAEYKVKAIQFIDAEVKLVKCLVQNIVIDISFNQLGGLCTLCFLEEVDQVVGKDHLFKQSVVLIKSWCYYESRILGAHHGLISTYALETLVLYIFHMFHGSLNRPFEVLYQFLDYFSKFDWDNFGVSLKGPVLKSAFPSIVVEKPENWGEDLMIRNDFFRECMDVFSVPSKSNDANLKVFPSKYLNIVDPLKENNNLGRSVNLGNFRRIRSAFKLGARRLGTILISPNNEAGEEIKKFFGNTLERHGDKFFPFPTSLSGSLTDETLSGDLSDYELEKDAGKISCTISGFYLPGGDTTWRISSSNTSDCSISSLDLSRAPHSSSYFSGSSAENGKSSNNSALSEGKSSSVCSNDNLVSIMPYSDENDDDDRSTDSGISDDMSSILSECLILDFRETNSDDDYVSREDLETLNPLADLSGDFDSQIRNLLWGKRCLGTGIHPPYHAPTKNQSFTCNLNIFPCSETSNQPMKFIYVFEENKKQKGTEPFHPNLNGFSYRDRSAGRLSWRNPRSNSFGNQRQFKRRQYWPEKNSTSSVLVTEKTKSEESHVINGDVCNTTIPVNIIFGSLGKFHFPMDDGSNSSELKNQKEAATGLDVDKQVYDFETLPDRVCSFLS